MSKDDLVRDFLRLTGCQGEIIDTKRALPLEVWRRAREDGARSGYYPLIVALDDTLLEMCDFNSNPEGLDGAAADRCVRDFRENLLKADLPEPESMFLRLFKGAHDDDEKLPSEDEVRSSMSDGLPLDYSVVTANLSGGEAELLLVKVPVKNPWEIFAHVPFGSYNDCPDASQIMSAAKRWFERHGACPCTVSSSEIEFFCEKPVGAEAAPALALEHYCLCYDIVEQNLGSVGVLADTLSDSEIWYFWWD